MEMEWKPTLRNQDDLAQFVLDNLRNPKLKDILSMARSELKALTQDPVFDGYDTGDQTKKLSFESSYFKVNHEISLPTCR